LRTKEVKGDSKTADLAAQSIHIDGTMLEPAEAPRNTGETGDDKSEVIRPPVQEILVPATAPLEDEGTEGTNEAGSKADGCTETACNLESDAMASLRGKPAPIDSGEQVESSQSPKLSSPVQSTPIHQIAAPMKSPQTEEVYRAKIPASPESIRSSSSMIDAVPESGLTVKDQILEAIRIVHGLSKHREDLPREVHVTILQALRDSHQDTLATNDWSSGSMWMDILEAGSV